MGSVSFQPDIVISLLADRVSGAARRDTWGVGALGAGVVRDCRLEGCGLGVTGLGVSGPGAAGVCVALVRGPPSLRVSQGRQFGIEFARYGWATHPKPFKPIARVWQVEVAHGALGRSRRLAKSFEQTETSATAWLELACIHLVLDTWSARVPRPRTAAEQAAKDARRAAPRVVPEPGDLGIYTP
jgi:hypothetical protein